MADLALVRISSKASPLVAIACTRSKTRLKKASQASEWATDGQLHGVIFV